MNKSITITHEQYHSLQLIEEFLTSEIYSTGNDYTDESILEDVSAILEACELRNELLFEKRGK